MNFFPGFKRTKIKVAKGIVINAVVGGDGPPVLLLHGYPQSHVMWHKVAPQLARDYTVVCADLRGYGNSSKPKGLPDHSNYSKRASAQDMVDVMRTLGHEKFHLVGHDRGARVSHRLARDHAKRVLSLTVLDISPTLKMYESTDMGFAAAYYHWFFLIQKPPMPEKMLAAVGPNYVLGRLGRGKGGLSYFSPAARRAYEKAFDKATIHASCEDYRAAASIDLVHDRKDRGKKIGTPVLVLWGSQGVIERFFDPMRDWREVAASVRGKALDCGHFLPEEKPREVLAELRKFLKSV